VGLSQVVSSITGQFWNLFFFLFVLLVVQHNTLITLLIAKGWVCGKAVIQAFPTEMETKTRITHA